jgi:hypothetical protein
VALYERNDWDAIKGPADLVSQYQNPPFIGVGNTGTMPGYMDGSKILRGYARRLDAVDFNLPNLSAADKARNTRLFFMFNPAEIQRQYLSYADTAGLKTLDTSDPTSASTPAFTTTTVSIELFFDRGEEVMMYKNHPGVLLDLAVFDMLAGQMPFTHTDIDMLQQKYLATQASTDPKINAQVTADYLKSSQSLMVDTSMRLAFIMSPNLMFQGTIQSASALFQKFSHRMTPTRMTLSLTLLITYTGQQFDATPYDPATQKALADSQANAALFSDATSTFTVASKAAADQYNYDGRRLAVDWASSWTTTPSGSKKAVPYSLPLRNANAGNDKFDMRENAANSPDHLDHQPGGFDCSTLVYRSYHVLTGWCDMLKLDRGFPTVSEDFINAAKAHTDLWQPRQLLTGGSPTGTIVDAEYFNYYLFDEDTRNKAKKEIGSKKWYGPNVGDVLIRSKGTHGPDDTGHAAMIVSFVNDHADMWQWQWSVIEAATANNNVNVRIRTYTTREIFGGNGYGPFSYIMRPGPIKGST